MFDPFNARLFQKFGNFCASLVTINQMQLEKIPISQRNKLLKRHGNCRSGMAKLLFESWARLGKFPPPGGDMNYRYIFVRLIYVGDLLPMIWKDFEMNLSLLSSIKRDWNHFYLKSFTFIRNWSHKTFFQIKKNHKNLYFSTRNVNTINILRNHLDPQVRDPQTTWPRRSVFCVVYMFSR